MPYISKARLSLPTYCPYSLVSLPSTDWPKKSFKGVVLFGLSLSGIILEPSSPLFWTPSSSTREAVWNRMVWSWVGYISPTPPFSCFPRHGTRAECPRAAICSKENPPHRISMGRMRFHPERITLASNLICSPDLKSCHMRRVTLSIYDASRGAALFVALCSRLAVGSAAESSVKCQLPGPSLPTSQERIWYNIGFNS